MLLSEWVRAWLLLSDIHLAEYLFDAFGLSAGLKCSRRNQKLLFALYTMLSLLLPLCLSLAEERVVAVQQRVALMEQKTTQRSPTTAFQFLFIIWRVQLGRNRLSVIGVVDF